MPRILTGGVWHETNSFCPLPTDLAAFRRFLYAEGDAVIATFRDTNTEIGGMIEAAKTLGFELVPTGFAGALPAGLVARAALDHIVALLCAGASPDAFDGALLALHGAMVAEGAEEADAYVAARIREALGPKVPIVATFDLHANLSRALVDAVDVLIGYDTLPHVDMGERGREAAVLLDRLLRGGARPCKAFRKLPLMLTPQTQATTDGPMRELMAECHAVERAPEIWTCSIVQGFPYCDVPQLGASVLAYADTQAAADAAADHLAQAYWRKREALLPTLVPLAEAARLAATSNRGPLILAEPADSVGGGAPGDGTHLLRALLEAKAGAGFVAIWDPVAAAQAARAGVGGRFVAPVGGRTLPLHGAPVRLDGTVRFAGPVRYKRDKAYMTGQPVDLGLCARIDAGGLHVLLTSERLMPFDTMHLREVGLDPDRERFVSTKCGSNWASAFGDIAAGHIYVDTPGITTSSLERLTYARARLSALAVLRLTKSSTLVDCCTGKSDGFSPLSIRPAYTPTKRYASVMLPA
jgi:microcystin degradation protein MlrC